MVDLSVKIGDVICQNPIQPASGGFSWEYNDVIDLNRLGALGAKTICREPRLGNPTPRMAETEAGIIQSISTIDNLAEITKLKAEELAPLATDRENFGTQKEMLYGENAAINLNHGPAHMLKNSKEFDV